VLILVLAVAVTALLIGFAAGAAYGGRHAHQQSHRADAAEDNVAAARRLQLLAEVAADHHRVAARHLRRALAASHAGEVTSP
jgi:hypothetical protein